MGVVEFFHTVSSELAAMAPPKKPFCVVSFTRGSPTKLMQQAEPLVSGILALCSVPTHSVPVGPPARAVVNFDRNVPFLAKRQTPPLVPAQMPWGADSSAATLFVFVNEVKTCDPAVCANSLVEGAPHA